MIAFAYEYPTFYQVIVTDGTSENSFTYEFGKDDDVDVCVREATLLAELEVAKKQPVIPTPV